MDEIRKVLQLSLGDSPKNVRELKSDIYELKNAIGDMVVAGKTGTTEYDQAVKLLGQDLQTLQQVQNSTKKEVDALDGSYNALVQRMRELKTEWRATNDVARRDELGKKITEINNQLKTLDYGIGNFQRNVGNYGNAWDSLAGTLNTAQSAGSQFTSGMQAMSGVLGLTTTQTESMNESLGVMRGVVGALNSAKGIAGLVKSLASQRAATKAAKAEADKEVATLKAQKVATDQVTVSTGAATVATKLLKAALMSIGIGAIVAAFGVLAANLDKVVGWFTKLGEKMGLVNKQNQDLKKSNDKLTSSIEARNKQLELDVELMQAKGAAQSEILQQQKTTIQANITEAKSEQAKLRAKLDELDATGKQKNLYKKLNEQYQKNEETLKDLNHQLEVINAKIDTDARQQAEKAAAAAKAAGDKRKQAEDKAAEELARAKEKAEELVNKVMEKGMTEREKLSKQHIATLAELEKYKAHITTEVYEKAVEAENKSYAKELADLISTEYADAYDKGIEDLENKIEARGINKKITDIVKNYFGGSFNEATVRQIQALDQLYDHYTKIMNNAVKSLSVYKKDMNAAAVTALGNLGEGDTLSKVRDYYKEYLEDTEAFLKRYGEPFTTAIKGMGEQFKEYAESYGEGLTGFFDIFTDRIGELMDQGRLSEAQNVVDQLWQEMKATIGTISEEADDVVTDAFFKFEGKFYEAMKGQWENDTEQNVLMIKMAYARLLDELDKELIELEKQKDKFIRMGVAIPIDILSRIAAIEADHRRLSIKRDREMWEERIDGVSTYANSVSGLLGNVASAWENTIKAKVKAEKMSDEQAEQSFEKLKWLQYGVTAINTASAIMKALADPALPFPLNTIEAAAALAMGLAQMQQIYSTSYSSKGSSSSSTPALVDRSPVTPTVSLNASEVGDSVQQNMRVYVVESDITEAQDAARARVSESTF